MFKGGSGIIDGEGDGIDPGILIIPLEEGLDEEVAPNGASGAAGKFGIPVAASHQIDVQGLDAVGLNDGSLHG